MEMLTLCICGLPVIFGILILIWYIGLVAIFGYSRMPRGKYERKPGNKSKALQAGNIPFKKNAKGNFNTKFKSNNSDTRSANTQKNEWMKHLLDKGYGEVGGPPNKAVQAIFGLIPNDEIHALILVLNKRLLPGEFSPILHLGFSTWLETFFILDHCRSVIENIFAKPQEILADRTDLDDMLAVECKAAIIHLERVHKRPDKTFEVEKGKHVDCCLDESNTDGLIRYIPKEDKDLMLKEKEASLNDIDRENLVRLTLHNSTRFPIISEMAVEWLGDEFQQGLWKSLNFNTLAPISTKAWLLLGNINDDEWKEAIKETDCMKQLMDEEEINFPCQHYIFDKKCRKGNGVVLCVKAHMAYLNTDRGYSYLHKIWRSWGPYLRCGCPPDTGCKYSITWFDQAIWYIFNHLEMVYPQYSEAGKMAFFMHFVRKNLKKPILAHLAYLHVRETLFKVTNKLVLYPDCDIMKTFGHTRLLKVCEMTLKDENFLKDKYKVKNGENSNTSVHTPNKGSGSESYLPPRVIRSAKSSLDYHPKIVDLTSTSDTIVSCTPGDESVTKGKQSFIQRNVDGIQGTLSFERAGIRSFVTDTNSIN